MNILISPMSDKLIGLELSSEEVKNQVLHVTRSAMLHNYSAVMCAFIFVNPVASCLRLNMYHAIR